MERNDVTAPRWYEVARAQGRSLRWIARQTGTPERTVYGYSAQAAQNYRTAPPEWLAKVSELLGVEVAA